MEHSHTTSLLSGRRHHHARHDAHTGGRWRAPKISDILERRWRLFPFLAELQAVSGEFPVKMLWAGVVIESLQLLSFAVMPQSNNWSDGMHVVAQVLNFTHLPFFDFLSIGFYACLGICAAFALCYVVQVTFMVVKCFSMGAYIAGMSMLETPALRTTRRFLYLTSSVLFVPLTQNLLAIAFARQSRHRNSTRAPGFTPDAWADGAPLVWFPGFHTSSPVAEVALATCVVGLVLHVPQSYGMAIFMNEYRFSSPHPLARCNTCLDGLSILHRFLSCLLFHYLVAKDAFMYFSVWMAASSLAMMLAFMFFLPYYKETMNRLRVTALGLTVLYATFSAATFAPGGSAFFRGALNRHWVDLAIFLGSFPLLFFLLYRYVALWRVSRVYKRAFHALLHEVRLSNPIVHIPRCLPRDVESLPENVKLLDTLERCVPFEGAAVDGPEKGVMAQRSFCAGGGVGGSGGAADAALFGSATALGSASGWDEGSLGEPADGDALMSTGVRCVTEASLTDSTCAPMMRKRNRLRNTLSRFVAPYVDSILFPSDIELATRFLLPVQEATGMPLSGHQMRYAATIFLKGIAKYPHNAFPRLAFHIFLLHMAHKPRLAVTLMRQFEESQARRDACESTTTEAALAVSFTNWRLKEELTQLLHLHEGHRLTALNVAKEAHREALHSTTEFWMALMSRSRSVAELTHASRVMMRAQQSGQRRYEALLDAQSGNLEVVACFAVFSDHIRDDKEMSAQCLQFLKQAATVPDAQQRKGMRLAGVNAAMETALVQFKFALASSKRTLRGFQQRARVKFLRPALILLSVASLALTIAVLVLVVQNQTTVLHMEKSLYYIGQLRAIAAQIAVAGRHIQVNRDHSQPVARDLQGMLSAYKEDFLAMFNEVVFGPHSRSSRDIKEFLRSTHVRQVAPGLDLQLWAFLGVALGAVEDMVSQPLESTFVDWIAGDFEREATGALSTTFDVFARDLREDLQRTMTQCLPLIAVVMLLQLIGVLVVLFSISTVRGVRSMAFALLRLIPLAEIRDVYQRALQQHRDLDAFLHQGSREKVESLLELHHLREHQRHLPNEDEAVEAGSTPACRLLGDATRLDATREESRGAASDRAKDHHHHLSGAAMVVAASGKSDSSSAGTNRRSAAVTDIHRNALRSAARATSETESENSDDYDDGVSSFSTHTRSHSSVDGTSDSASNPTNNARGDGRDDAVGTPAQRADRASGAGGNDAVNNGEGHTGATKSRPQRAKRVASGGGHHHHRAQDAHPHPSRRRRHAPKQQEHERLEAIRSEQAFLLNLDANHSDSTYQSISIVLFAILLGLIATVVGLSAIAQPLPEKLADHYERIVNHNSAVRGVKVDVVFTMLNTAYFVMRGDMRYLNDYIVVKAQDEWNLLRDLIVERLTNDAVASLYFTLGRMLEGIEEITGIALALACGEFASTCRTTQVPADGVYLSKLSWGEEKDLIIVKQASTLGLYNTRFNVLQGSDKDLARTAAERREMARKLLASELLTEYVLAIFDKLDELNTAFSEPHEHEMYVYTVVAIAAAIGGVAVALVLLARLASRPPSLATKGVMGWLAMTTLCLVAVVVVGAMGMGQSKRMAVRDYMVAATEVSVKWNMVLFKTFWFPVIYAADPGHSLIWNYRFFELRRDYKSIQLLEALATIRQGNVHRSDVQLINSAQQLTLIGTALTYLATKDDPAIQPAVDVFEDEYLMNFTWDFEKEPDYLVTLATYGPVDRQTYTTRAKDEKLPNEAKLNLAIDILISNRQDAATETIYNFVLSGDTLVRERLEADQLILKRQGKLFTAAVALAATALGCLVAMLCNFVIICSLEIATIGERARGRLRTDAAVKAGDPSSPPSAAASPRKPADQLRSSDDDSDDEDGVAADARHPTQRDAGTEREASPAADDTDALAFGRRDGHHRHHHHREATSNIITDTHPLADDHDGAAEALKSASHAFPTDGDGVDTGEDWSCGNRREARTHHGDSVEPAAAPAAAFGVTGGMPRVEGGTVGSAAHNTRRGCGRLFCILPFALYLLAIALSVGITIVLALLSSNLLPLGDMLDDATQRDWRIAQSMHVAYEIKEDMSNYAVASERLRRIYAKHVALSQKVYFGAPEDVNKTAYALLRRDPRQDELLFDRNKYYRTRKFYGKDDTGIHSYGFQYFVTASAAAKMMAEESADGAGAAAGVVAGNFGAVDSRFFCSAALEGTIMGKISRGVGLMVDDVWASYIRRIFTDGQDGFASAFADMVRDYSAVLNGVAQSDFLLLKDVQRTTRKLFGAIIALTAILLVVIVLLFFCTLLLLYRHLVREDAECRLLMKVLPPHVRARYPALEAFLTGAYGANAATGLEASISRIDATMSELAQCAVIAVDSDTGVVLRFSELAEALFGFSAGEVLGQHITTLIPCRASDAVWDEGVDGESGPLPALATRDAAADRSGEGASQTQPGKAPMSPLAPTTAAPTAAMPTVAELLRHAVHAPQQLTLPRRDGGQQTITFTSRVVALSGGHVTVLQCREVADRGEVEVMEGVVQATSSLSTDGVLLMCADGTIIRSNLAAANMFGFEADELINTNVRAILPSDAAVLLDNFVTGERTLPTSTDGAGEEGRGGRGGSSSRGRRARVRRIVSGLRKGGSRFRVAMTVVEVRSDTQSFLVATFEDDTHSRDVKTAARTYQTVINLSPVPIALVSDQGRILELSKPACELLQWSPSDAKGVSVMGNVIIAQNHNDRDSLFPLARGGAHGGGQTPTLDEEEGNSNSNSNCINSCDLLHYAGDGGLLTLPGNHLSTAGNTNAPLSYSTSARTRRVLARRRDQSSFPAELTVHELRAGTGGGLLTESSFLAFLRDTSKLREADAQGQLAHGVVEASVEPLVVMTAQGTLRYLNAAAERLLQYSTAEVMELSYTLLIGTEAGQEPPETVESIVQQHRRRSTMGSPTFRDDEMKAAPLVAHSPRDKTQLWLGNYSRNPDDKSIFRESRVVLVRSRDGSTRPMELRLAELPPVYGTTDCLVAAFLRDAAASLRQERSLMLHEALQAVCPSPILLVDGVGRLLQLSDGAETCFGYHASEVRGVGVDLLLPTIAESFGASAAESASRLTDAGRGGREAAGGARLGHFLQSLDAEDGSVLDHSREGFQETSDVLRGAHGFPSEVAGAMGTGHHDRHGVRTHTVPVALAAHVGQRWLCLGRRCDGRLFSVSIRVEALTGEAAVVAETGLAASESQMMYIIYCDDITELKDAEAQSVLVQQIPHHLDVPLLHLDAEGTILSANDIFEKELRYASDSGGGGGPSSVVGQRFPSLLVNPGAAERLRQLLREHAHRPVERSSSSLPFGVAMRAVQTGTGSASRCNVRVRCGDGTETLVQCRIAKAVGPGATAATEACASNIRFVVFLCSADAAVEDTLIGGEVTTTLLRTCPDALLVMDRDGIIVQASPAAERLFGSPPAADAAGRSGAAAPSSAATRRSFLSQSCEGETRDSIVGQPLQSFVVGSPGKAAAAGAPHASPPRHEEELAASSISRADWFEVRRLVGQRVRAIARDRAGNHFTVELFTRAVAETGAGGTDGESAAVATDGHSVNNSSTRHLRPRSEAARLFVASVRVVDADEAAQRVERSLAATVEQMAIPVAITDSHGTVDMANAALCRVFGYSSSAAFVGHDISMFLTSDDGPCGTERVRAEPPAGLPFTVDATRAQQARSASGDVFRVFVHVKAVEPPTAETKFIVYVIPSDWVDAAGRDPASTRLLSSWRKITSGEFFDMNGGSSSSDGAAVTATTAPAASSSLSSPQRRHRRLEGWLADEAGLPFAIVDADGTTIRLSRAAQRSFGWSADDAIGADIAALVTRDATQMGVVKQALEKMMTALDAQGPPSAAAVASQRIVGQQADGPTMDRVLFLQRRSGETVPVKVIMKEISVDEVEEQALTDAPAAHRARCLAAALAGPEAKAGPPLATEAPRMYLVLLLDLSTQVDAAQQKRLHDAAMSLCPQPTIFADAAGAIRLFNPAAERCFGWEAEEVLGRNMTILMSDKTAAMHEDFMQLWRHTGARTIVNGTPRAVTAKRKNGNEFPATLMLREVTQVGPVQYDAPSSDPLSPTARTTAAAKASSPPAAAVAHERAPFLVAQLVDNSETHKDEQLAQLTKALLESSDGEALLVVDAHDAVRLASPAALHLLGYASLADIAARHCLTRQSPLYRPERHDEMANGEQSGGDGDAGLATGLARGLHEDDAAHIADLLPQHAADELREAIRDVIERVGGRASVPMEEEIRHIMEGFNGQRGGGVEGQPKQAQLPLHAVRRELPVRGGASSTAASTGTVDVEARLVMCGGLYLGCILRLCSEGQDRSSSAGAPGAS